MNPNLAVVEKTLEAPIRMLLVEDYKREAFLIESALSKARPGEFRLEHVMTLEEALPKLAEMEFDVVLLDMSLPGASGMEAMRSIHAILPHLPIVILTGQNDERTALAAIHQGAQDYLIKDGIGGGEIMRSVRYAMQRKQFEDKLIALANYDMLTGLANRSLFENRLELALSRSRRSGNMAAVLFLDLDRFKEVNDTLGHEAGDELLKQVSVRLQNCLRGYDIIARFGGDEFAVLLEDVSNPHSLAVIARKMLETLAKQFVLENGKALVGVSIGIALATADMMASEVMKQADMAMYRAKNFGSSNFQFYTEHMHHETIRRLELEEELAVAMETKDQFCMYYQPKLDAKTNKLAGAEALIRWKHPERGLLAPADFLPMMSGASWALAIDTWVLQTVCHDMQMWKASGAAIPQVSVHLSDHFWQDTKVVEMLSSLIEESGLSADCLAIEMVEKTSKALAPDKRSILTRLKELGTGVHLDNFGGGNSSLDALMLFPFDTLKLDRHMIKALGQPTQDMLAKMLVEFGHALGMRVIAEGVETDEQKTILAGSKCDQWQGKIIGAPLPAENFCQQWLNS